MTVPSRRTCERVAAVHEQAAEFYRQLHQPERAGHEARLADIQRDGAAVERGRPRRAATGR